MLIAPAICFVSSMTMKVSIFMYGFRVMLTSSVTRKRGTDWCKIISCASAVLMSTRNVPMSDAGWQMRQV